MTSTAADRQRRRRARRAAGKRVFKIEAGEAEIEATLAWLEFLPRHGTDDPAEIERALAAFVRHVCGFVTGDDA